MLPPVKPITTGRARPLPPDERREMLVRATLPLLAEHGMKVTTRQIAQAAGVAEGTIFRVFPDKDALIRAAVQQALDPEPTLEQLRAIDLDLPMRVRLLQLTSVLQGRFIRVFNLMLAFRMHPPTENLEHQRTAAHTANQLVVAEVVRLLEPDRDQFRLPVAEVARVVRLLVFSGSHPLITDGNLLTADEITTVILDGVRQPTAPPRTRTRTTEGGHRC
jgi:AcrR family transcriptional regulator